MGHRAETCTYGDAGDLDKPSTKPFIFLHVDILREYLEMELKPPTHDQVAFKFNLERAIDDWVFLCFFVGNDFLPHLPSLEIREGAIDLLIRLYKQNADKMQGYLTDNGEVHLMRVQVLMEAVSEEEDAIFRRRRADEERRQSRGSGRQSFGQRG